MKHFFKNYQLAGELRRLARQCAGEGKPLSVLEDVVFKAMLASDNEDSREALRCLLSACTRREVSTVRVLNSEVLPAHLAAKYMRLDVNVTFNDGEVADLEMQVEKSGDDLKFRAAAYAAVLKAGQSRRGKDYKEIKRAYQIFFLNCVLFPGSAKLPRRYGYREEEEGDLLTTAVEIIFYELPKLEQRVRDFLAGRADAETLREDEKWCIYMRYRDDERAKPLIRELYRKEGGIMRAEKALSKVDRDYIKYVREMDAWKNRREAAIRQYNEGIRQGEEKGMAKGKAEANLETARKLKAMGILAEQIHEATGLDTETIDFFPQTAMLFSLSRHIRGMELRKPLTEARRHGGKRMKERENVLLLPPCLSELRVRFSSFFS